MLAFGLIRLHARGSQAGYPSLEGESSLHFPPDRSGHANTGQIGETHDTPDPIPARLAALKTTPTPELKQQWRDLFDSEPPPFNRRYLESRLAYRIQELAYGGLKPETVKRLEELGEELQAEVAPSRNTPAGGPLPIVGTRLLREWRGVKNIVTVTADGFEWQGRPYKSLSAIARAITGTRWNGWTFSRAGGYPMTPRARHSCASRG